MLRTIPLSRAQQIKLCGGGRSTLVCILNATCHKPHFKQYNLIVIHLSSEYDSFSPELDRIAYAEQSFEWMRKFEFVEIERVRQNGLRCLKLSHDGMHLACGDSTGNIRIYTTDFMEQVRSGFIALH